MTKKILTAFLAMVVSLSATSQVFNTGQTLKPRQFSLGIEPAVLIKGNGNFILFLHGGAGITNGIDLGLTLGVLGPDNYFGANVEFAITRLLSIAVGAHNSNIFGIDATLNATFPIRKDVNIFTGADIDIDFPKNKAQLLLWLPIGVEVGLRNNVSFIFEAEIGLTDPAGSLIGGGLNFYF
ncbi:MAG: hypothetical protein PHE03_02175 [Bacteroidales bacterium]|nr:hypothetical protein [Bacteroidales bacterium]MDD3891086.1 hypothetical protein [Bacteroidales bacterium]